MHRIDTLHMEDDKRFPILSRVGSSGRTVALFRMRPESIIVGWSE